MEDNITKELLMNFQKASQQLDEATDVIKEFVNGLDEYFKVSKNVENSIVEVSKSVNFTKIEGLVSSFSSELSKFDSDLSELDKELKAKTSMLKNTIASVNATTENSLDNQLNAISDLKSDMNDIKKEINDIAKGMNSITAAVENLSKVVFSIVESKELDNSIFSEKDEELENQAISGESELMKEKTE